MFQPRFCGYGKRAPPPPAAALPLGARRGAARAAKAPRSAARLGWGPGAHRSAEDILKSRPAAAAHLLALR